MDMLACSHSIHTLDAVGVSAMTFAPLHFYGFAYFLTNTYSVCVYYYGACTGMHGQCHASMVSAVCVYTFQTVMQCLCMGI